MMIVKLFDISDIPSDIRWITNISPEIIRDILKNGRSLKYTRKELAHVPNKTWKRSDVKLIKEVVAAKENGLLKREKGIYPRVPTREEWIDIDSDWAFWACKDVNIYSPASPVSEYGCDKCGFYHDYCKC